jgi:hypothetical protein
MPRPAVKTIAAAVAQLHRVAEMPAEKLMKHSPLSSKLSLGSAENQDSHLKLLNDIIYTTLGNSAVWQYKIQTEITVSVTNNSWATSDTLLKCKHRPRERMSVQEQRFPCERPGMSGPGASAKTKT